MEFYTKYITQTLKDAIFMQYWQFKSFHIKQLKDVFETLPS